MLSYESEVINVTQAQRGLLAKLDQLRDDVGLSKIGCAAWCTFFVLVPGKSRGTVRYGLDLLLRFGFGSIRLILDKRVSYLPARKTRPV